MAFLLYVNFCLRKYYTVFRGIQANFAWHCVTWTLILAGGSGQCGMRNDRSRVANKVFQAELFSMVAICGQEIHFHGRVISRRQSAGPATRKWDRGIARQKKMSGSGDLHIKRMYAIGLRPAIETES